MKPRGAVAVFAAGLIAVGEVAPDKHQPHWMDSYHSHVELPEGTTSHFSRIAVDSGANVNTNTASAGLRTPYISIVESL